MNDNAAPALLGLLLGGAVAGTVARLNGAGVLIPAATAGLLTGSAAYALHRRAMTRSQAVRTLADIFSNRTQSVANVGPASPYRLTYFHNQHFDVDVPVFTGPIENIRGEKIVGDAWTGVAPREPAPPTGAFTYSAEYEAWLSRQAAWDPSIYLPKGAAASWDQYSKFVGLPCAPGTIGYGEGRLCDEYDRPGPPGVNFNLAAAVVDVAAKVLPYVPGIGTAASAALGAAIALGQGKSLEDAALAAARASLPPEGKLAFDIGVGVANGKSVDEVARSETMKYIPNGESAYQQGRALASR